MGRRHSARVQLPTASLGKRVGSCTFAARFWLSPPARRRRSRRPPVLGPPNSKLVARISRAMRSRCVSAQSARSVGTDITTRMRSDTSSPVDLRNSCSSRIRSLAQPSASSSGVTVPSNTTRPVPSGSAAVNSGSAATSRELYSSGCSTAGPAVSVPSGLTTPSPALTALMAACTSLPSRGPATRALTVSSNRP